MGTIEPVAVTGNACTAKIWGGSPDAVSEAAVSADGRYVAFLSSRAGLITGDTNHEMDALVRDRVTGTVERVSVWSDGTQATENATKNPGGVETPSISADGRYVTFFSWHALAPGTTEGQLYTYLHDRVTGTTEVVSIAPDGSFADATAYHATISDDGRYVAFGDSHGNMYVRDRVAGSTTMAVSGAGAPMLSGNGRYLAFISSDPNLTGDAAGCTGTFVKDLVTQTIQRMDVTSNGDGAESVTTPGNACGSGLLPAITDDGRYVAFTSDSWNLYGLPNPTSVYEIGFHVYVRDRATGTTTRVDTLGYRPPGTDVVGDAMYPSISDDGRYVAYRCSTCDGQSGSKILVTDRVTGDTRRVGVSPQGVVPNGNESNQFVKEMSGDGRYMTFLSTSTNLSPQDVNGWTDIYIQRIN